MCMEYAIVLSLMATQGATHYDFKTLKEIFIGTAISSNS